MNIGAMVNRIMKQFLRDKRSLALLVLAPMLILTLIWLVLDNGVEGFSLFDKIGGVLLGFLVFFFVFIIGGISFLRERTQGTLEKLLSTPIKRWEVVIGYLLGFGIFASIQSFIIVTYSIYVLGMHMEGHIFQILIVTFLLAMMGLTLATLLSAYANNEFQMMQFIPLVIIPQVFFSGIFDLEAMDQWLQVLSKLMPLTYGAEALQQMMLHGHHVGDEWANIAVIIGLASLFFVINILALKRHRRL